MKKTEASEKPKNYWRTHFFSKDNKKLFLYLGIIYALVLMKHKLPHNSYSISDYIMSPFINKIDGFNVIGIIFIIIFVICAANINTLERFIKRSPVFIFLILIVFVLPAMNYSINGARTLYHYVANDGLNALDLKNTNISTTCNEDDLVININLILDNYGRSGNAFKVKVYLPESLSSIIGTDSYETDSFYYSSPNEKEISIMTSLVVKADAAMQEEILNSKWEEDGMNFELYDDEEVVKIIKHGR